jgi:hypothetical protein
MEVDEKGIGDWEAEGQGAGCREQERVTGTQGSDATPLKPGNPPTGVAPQVKQLRSAGEVALSTQQPSKSYTLTPKASRFKT